MSARTENKIRKTLRGWGGKIFLDSGFCNKQNYCCSACSHNPITMEHAGATHALPFNMGIPLPVSSDAREDR